MQLTARLKSVEELKRLGSFMCVNSYESLEFKGDVITRDMLNLGLVNLSWSKLGKMFVSDNYNYSLDWLTDITVSDEKLRLGLEIYGLTLTVRILEMDESLRGNGLYKAHKDKFAIESILYLGISDDALCIHGSSQDKYSASYTFDSKKKLTKWIRNLIKCKSVA